MQNKGEAIGANKFEKWYFNPCWVFLNLGLTVKILENHNRSKALEVILKIFKLYHQACRWAENFRKSQPIKGSLFKVEEAGNLDQNYRFDCSPRASDGGVQPG